MIGKVVWTAVIALGGGGIYYAAHPSAKSCESVIHTGNIATNAFNEFGPNDDPNQLLATINTQANKLSDLSLTLKSPFNIDAANAASQLRGIIASIRAGDIATVNAAVSNFNSVVETTNDDCKHATSGVSGG